MLAALKQAKSPQRSLLVWGIKVPRPEVISPLQKKIKISTCLCPQQAAFAYFSLFREAI